MQPQEAESGVFQQPVREFYVNLLRIERRKCLLVTEATTLFSSFQPGVLKRELKAFGDFLLGGMFTALVSAGFEPRRIMHLVRPRPYRVCRATDRRILGSMNDFAFQLEIGIEMGGGLERADIARMGSTVNDSPLSYLDIDSPRRVPGRLLSEGAV